MSDISGSALEAGGAALRAAVIFVFGLAAVRVADKRLLGKNTAFDVIVGVILGSVLSRSINGSSPVLSTMASVLVLLGLHWLLAFVSSRSHRLSVMLKGEAMPLVRDGEILWEAMRRNHLSEGDLLEMLRLHGRLERAEEVRDARLERNGEISAIPRHGKPSILDVDVREGVQTVRIEIAT